MQMEVSVQMKSRREAIMDTAEKLFNEKGFNRVSLRNISDSLGISKGNLTYYFQKKEDLIEACVLRSHESYQKHTVPQTLEELNHLFSLSLEQRKNRPYYFRNYAQLSEVCPRVYEIQLSVIEDLAEVLNSAIKNLIASGELRQDCACAYDGIVSCMISVLAYGIPSVMVSSPAEQLSCIWSILIPCLTEKGLRKIKEIL